MMKALFRGSISRRQGCFSQTPPSPQQQGSGPKQPLIQQILHTRYVVNREDLQIFLEQKFPQQSDFAIKTKNGRWIFMVPEKITEDDIRRLIGTIQTKLDRERASRRGVAHTW